VRTLIGMALAILLFLGLGFAQGNSPESIRSDVFTKGTNGEPAFVPGAQIVLRTPVTRTESDAQGAFAVDGLPQGAYQIEGNAPYFFAALAVKVSADTSSTVPIAMKVAPVASMMSPQLTGLKAMDCAFSRKVQHA
jgi:Carboxypeptidase regulatory-like domain